MSLKTINSSASIDYAKSLDQTMPQSLKSVTFSIDAGHNSKIKAIDAMIKAQNTLKGSVKAINVSIPFNKFI